MITNREKDLEICIICGKKKSTGLKINRAFICSECEQEIVHTEVEHERYNFFVEQMKKVCFNHA